MRPLGVLSPFETIGCSRQRKTDLNRRKAAALEKGTELSLNEPLIQLVRDRALEFGDFTLASGRKASFYLDCRKVTLDAMGARLIADAMIEALDDDWPDAVGGMAVGAVPIAAAILTRAGEMNRHLSGFFVRKEAKQHGKGRLVEGPVQPGQRVVIVEDVVTSGGSSITAVRLCRDFGLQVDRVLTIVDRLAGGAQRFAELGCRLSALMTIEDLGIKTDAC
jgi:orotate phosphoribosyltransferase